MRFNSKFLKLICTFQCIIDAIFYTAIVTYVPSVVLSVFTGWPIWMIIIALSMIAVFITSIGGIKAVIWSDVLLFFCMLSGIVLIILQAVSRVGGPYNMWNAIKTGERLNSIDFSMDPTIRFSVWSFVLGADVFYFCEYGLRQVSVQRYTWLGSLRKAQTAVCLSGLTYGILTILLVATGLTIYGLLCACWV